MTIKFNSIWIFKKYARGFKASYEFIKVGKSKKTCKTTRGCPQSCTCHSYASHKGKRIAVQCESLSNMPSKIPRETTVLLLQRNEIKVINSNEFVKTPNILHVDISNNRIFRIDSEAFFNGSMIEFIRLNSNFLKDIPTAVFNPLQNLKTLDLGRNLMKNLDNGTFSGLSELKILSLRLNRIANLPQNVFDTTTNLTHLYLQKNNISSLPDGLFQHLSKLILLNLANNNIKYLTRNTFQGLKSLEHLNLQGNRLSIIPQVVFDDLQNLKTIKLDKFIHCCYAEKAIPGLKCESIESNEFSSCDDLMKNTTLRIFIWILGLSALVGNLLVIVKRIMGKDLQRNTHSLLLTNLAVADFLMGVYLIIIASLDIHWKGVYFKHDVNWRSKVGCRVTGMISMLSSEVSVAMLAIVTYDRLVCIVFPFKVQKLSRNKALFICGCVWVAGLVISIVPIFDLNYFLNDEDDFGFYGRSSVCLPLQLSSELQAGWQYSLTFFLIFNFIAFTFMLIAYIVIIKKVRKSASAVRSTAVNRESSLAKKVVFIVLTDFLCWMPVIVMSFLSFTGIYSDPSKLMYVWIAVFVLPINSSINPFLYTFSTIHSHRRSSSGGYKAASIDDRESVLKTVKLEAQVDCSQGINAEKQKLSERVKYRITLLERLDIQKPEDGMGFFLAQVKSLDCDECCLIKCFSPGRKDAWKKELDILSQLKDDGHQNIIKYRWNCLANEHISDGKQFNVIEINSALLICFEQVPNKRLHDFMQDKDAMTLEVVCSLCIDIISAIEFLQSCWISSNNINSRSIIVCASESEVVPVRAVLVDFSRANKLRVYDDGCYAKTDIIHFGRLLKILLKTCNIMNAYTQVDEVISLCDKERSQSTTTAIKTLLLEVLSSSDKIETTNV